MLNVINLADEQQQLRQNKKKTKEEKIPLPLLVVISILTHSENGKVRILISYL